MSCVQVLFYLKENLCFPPAASSAGGFSYIFCKKDCPHEINCPTYFFSGCILSFFQAHTVYLLQRKMFYTLQAGVPQFQVGLGLYTICNYTWRDGPKVRLPTWRIVEGAFEKLEAADSPYDLYPFVDWDN